MILRAPGVARLLGALGLYRLPATAVGVVVVLHGRFLTGSVAAGGAAAGVATLAFALGTPVMARLADRYAVRRVLVATVIASSVFDVVVAVLPRGVSPVLLVLAASAAAFVRPPLGPVMRGLWRVLVPDERERAAAFAYDISSAELSYMLGPLVFAAGLAAWSTRAAMLACAAGMLMGTGLFASSRFLRAEVELEAAAPHGRMRSPALTAFALIFFAMNLGAAAFEVSTLARAGAAGGVLLAVWGAGSALGGLLYARRGDAASARLAQAFCFAMALAGIGMAFGPPRVALGALLFVAGLGLAPSASIFYAIADRVAPARRAAEFYAWITTAGATGFAAGSALTGALAQGVSIGAAFAAGAAAYAAAAVIAGVPGANPVR